MNANLYAHALYKALKDSTDTEVLINNFVEILKSRGHYKLLPEILRVYKVVEEKNGESKPIIFVSKKTDLELFEEKINEYKKEFNISSDVDVVIDETLVGGFTLRTSDKIIDSSYKKSLLDLYRLITT